MTSCRSGSLILGRLSSPTALVPGKYESFGSVESFGLLISTKTKSSSSWYVSSYCSDLSFFPLSKYLAECSRLSPWLVSYHSLGLSSTNDSIAIHSCEESLESSDSSLSLGLD